MCADYLEAKRKGGGRKKKKVWLICRGRCGQSCTLVSHRILDKENPASTALIAAANHTIGPGSIRGWAASLMVSKVAGLSLWESSFAADMWAAGL